MMMMIMMMTVMKASVTNANCTPQTTSPVAAIIGSAISAPHFCVRELS